MRIGVDWGEIGWIIRPDAVEILADPLFPIGEQGVNPMAYLTKIGLSPGLKHAHKIMVWFLQRVLPYHSLVNNFSAQGFTKVTSSRPSGA